MKKRGEQTACSPNNKGGRKLLFEFLGSYVCGAMQWVHTNVIADYVLIVTVFTIILKLCTLPADISQRKSSAKMNSAQGELKKMQERYKDNPELVQKKQMEYYKKNGINPYASCLPAIITMLFFMVFLRAMYQWANINTIQIAIEAGKGNYDLIKNFNWLWVHNIWQPDSGLAPVVMDAAAFSKIQFNTVERYFDASTMEWVRALAADPDRYSALMQPILDMYSGVNNGWFVLPLLAGGSMLLQQFIMKKLNPAMANTPGMGNTFMYTMAAVSVFFCITSNTAFSIYWLVSNIMAIVTQFFVNMPGKKKQDESNNEALPASGGSV